MRLLLIALPAALCAAPALAAEPLPQIPSELTDPAMADKLGRMAGALSKALLDVPVGEIQAIAEGRAVTDADRRRTVRDVAGRDDPNLERDIERQAAAGGVAMQAGIKAMVAAMPAILRAMQGAADEIDGATANLPSPNYPRR